MNNTDLVLSKMIEFDSSDPKRIQHFIKVYTFAHHIAINEKVDDETLEIIDVASILHDIGIHPSEEKYGDCNGTHQEELGPIYAEKLLDKLSVYPKSFINRICYLISHHHTYTDINEIDLQILVEADFLVNAFEDNLSKKAILNASNKFFKTNTGINLLNTMFSLNS